MSVVQIDLVLKKPHKGQLEIINNAKRFNHLRCGRRFGKTSLIEELCTPVLEGWPVGIWFPTYKDLSEVWKDVKKTYSPLIYTVNEQLKQIVLITERQEGSRSVKGLIDFWSMEDPDSGQGRKYKRGIIDEAAKAAKLYQAWENTIRPTLTDYIGDAYILSRPKGKQNGFYLLEEKHRKFSNWAFFHFTTYDNPYIDKNEIKEAKDQLDEDTFKQEYLAEYVDANDKPFLYAFSAKKHVIKDYKVNPHLNLIISFDFNKDPMTCSIGQLENVRKLTIFDAMSLPNGSTPELCDMILAKYPQFQDKFTVTGDSTGKNRNPLLVGEVNHYTIIRQKLQLLERDLLVQKKNKELSASRILCNSILQNAEISITENCKDIITDMGASVDANGYLIKNQIHPLHFFDNFRYMLEACFPDFIEKPHKYTL